MNDPVAVVILVLLLLGPIAWRRIERNIEAYFFVLGVLSILFAGALDRRVAVRAIAQPIPIAVAVVAAGTIFGLVRGRLDRTFESMRAAVPRGLLTALAIVVIAALSSLITAIIAALVLVEVVGMLRLDADSRVNVTVAGCFAIGICSSLTPLGGPLSTLAAGALRLGFWGLFELLAIYVVPGTIVCAAFAGFLARDGPISTPKTTVVHVRETATDAVLQGIRIFGFVSGLVLIGEAFAPVVAQYVAQMSEPVLFWVNSVSAVLDNSTLVALELHRMEPERARSALIALLVAGGMLIPGNVPNIVAAGPLRISSAGWARLGVPMGLVLMAAYFIALQIAG